MEKTGLVTKRKKLARISEAKTLKSLTITEKDVVRAMLVAAGAFVGRVLVFEYMNPFVTASPKPMGMCSSSLMLVVRTYR